MHAPLTRRRAETRAKILDAAISVFAERGVMGASVEEICDRAGFTRGAFYSNYSSKDELVIGILELDLANTTKGFDMLVGDQADLAIEAQRDEDLRQALIRLAVREFISAQKTDRDFLRVYPELRLYAARSPEVLPAFLETHAQTVDILSAQLDALVEHYGVTLAMPTKALILNLAALWDVTMLHVVMHMEPWMTTINDLEPGVLDDCLSPMFHLLDASIVDATALHHDTAG